MGVVRLFLVAEEAERKERRKREIGDVGHLQALVFWVSACSSFSPLPPSEIVCFIRGKSQCFW